MCSAPAHERVDPCRADVLVEAVELGRAGDPQSGRAKAARDDLGSIVEEADPRRRVLVGPLRQVDVIE
jgi:hypothetical protein